MKTLISSQGDTLDEPASPVSGRCSTFVFADTDWEAAW
jgi:predicted Fe-Mo cluster-binding NifX family protein